MKDWGNIELKGWSNNAITFVDNGDAGTCPKCGGNNIMAEKHVFKRRLSVSFLCRECGSSAHFDGSLPETMQGIAEQ